MGASRDTPLSLAESHVGNDCQSAHHRRGDREPSKRSHGLRCRGLSATLHLVRLCQLQDVILRRKIRRGALLTLRAKSALHQAFLENPRHLLRLHAKRRSDLFRAKAIFVGFDRADNLLESGGDIVRRATRQSAPRRGTARGLRGWRRRGTCQLWATGRRWGGGTASVRKQFVEGCAPNRIEHFGYEGVGERA